jgi:hypothetical protein
MSICGCPEGEVARCRAKEATWTRRHLGVHAAAAGACLERLGPSIAVASGSAAVMHVRNGSMAGGQGEEGAGVLRLVGPG